MVPLAVHLVRAGADRGLVAGVDVVEALLGDRGERRGVAHHLAELGERPAQGGLEGQVVDLLQAGHLLALAGTLDLGHEAGGVDGVLGVLRVVPCRDERVGVDRLAVVEGATLLELDRPHGLVVVGLDALGQAVEDQLAGLEVGADQRLEEQVKDRRALGLVALLSRGKVRRLGQGRGVGASGLPGRGAGVGAVVAASVTAVATTTRCEPKRKHRCGSGHPEWGSDSHWGSSFWE